MFQSFTRTLKTCYVYNKYYNINHVTRTLCYKASLYSNKSNYSTKTSSEPLKEIPNNNVENENVLLDDKTIQLLERLSLVNFGSEKSKEILKDAIKFADKIHSVNVDGVKPMINVLEEYSTPMREDNVNMDNTSEDILLNAKAVEEDYFISPPSNVPLYEDSNDTNVDKSKSSNKNVSS